MDLTDALFVFQILCVVGALPTYLASRRTPRTRRPAHGGYATLAVVLLVCSGGLAALSLLLDGEPQAHDTVFALLPAAITVVLSALTLRRSLSTPPVRGQRLRT
jgi:hypothetical protein